MDELLETINKDRFRISANKLLNECFLLKDNKDTKSEYNFVLNKKELFNQYFDYLGYELSINEQDGVIGLKNEYGSGRYHLRKNESIILLILRLLYIEKKKQLSLRDEVIIIVDEIYDKYNMLKLNNRLDKTSLRTILSTFRRYHLIDNLDSDMANTETRIRIYPSILMAINNESIDQLYALSKQRLEKYELGGNDELQEID